MLTSFYSAFGCREVITPTPLPKTANYFYYYLIIIVLLVIVGFLIGLSFCAVFILCRCSSSANTFWRCLFPRRPSTTHVIEEQGDDDC